MSLKENSIRRRTYGAVLWIQDTRMMGGKKPDEDRAVTPLQSAQISVRAPAAESGPPHTGRHLQRGPLSSALGKLHQRASSQPDASTAPLKLLKPSSPRQMSWRGARWSTLKNNHSANAANYNIHERDVNGPAPLVLPAPPHFAALPVMSHRGGFISA